MSTLATISRKSSGAILWGVVLAGLWLISLYDYLLFHSLVELFAIVVACSVFVIAWNSRRVLDNHYLLFVGIALVSVALVDLVHMLAYQGMRTFPGGGVNLATELWIVMRYLLAGSLLVAPLFLKWKPRPALTVAVYVVVTAALLAAVFLDYIPDCYNDAPGPDHGLTPFKKVSEYVISGVLLAALALLAANRRAFDRTVFGLTAGAILLSVATELPFALYDTPTDWFNMLGHLFELLSFYLLYKALVETGIRRPFDLLFRNLKQREEQLRLARDELEERVQARTAALAGAVGSLENEMAARAEAEDKLRQVNRALRTISECNQALVRATSEPALLQDVCRIIVDFGGYPAAWVGYREDDAAGSIRPVAQAGAMDGIADGLRLTWTDGPRGRDPMAVAIRTGEPSHVGNLASDAQSPARRATAGHGGLASAVALPLIADGRAFGALTIYASQPAAFDAEQMKLLAELAEDLAFGITVLRTRAERERVGRQLDAERQRLFTAMNMLPGYVALLSPDHRIHFANRRFVDIFGDPAGKPCHQVLHGRDSPCQPCHVDRILASQRMREWQWTLADGRALEVRAYPFTDTDGSPVVLELGIDVTERKRLENEVLEISEAERRRIGQDLHDSLGQTLTGVAFLSAALSQRLAAEKSADASQAGDISRMTKEAIRQARGLARGLVPVEMKADGLMASLQDLAANVTDLFSVKCTFACPQPVLLHDSVAATHLYRIAQEAINNAIKHGSARNIAVSLASDRKSVILQIDDDGPGLPSDLDGVKGSGLRIMGYRAHMLGGQIGFTRGPRGGTRVVCAIPTARA